MKKFIITAALFMVGSCCYSCDNVVCPAPYDMTSGVSRFFSNITGQNFIAEKVGESLIKKAVKKNIISGNIKSDLKSYSVRDLKAGRFKSITITGSDVNVQGIQISSFKAKTLCDFNYIAEDKNGDIIIKENIPMAITAVITEDDLNKTMNSSDYKRLINDINSLGSNFNIFQITSTSIKLKNDKMYYVLKYSMPFMRKTKEVVITADVQVENGKIKLANTTMQNNSVSLDVDKFSKLMNYINPLDFSAKILENKDAKFNIENIKIEDKKITIDGKMTVQKDKE